MNIFKNLFFSSKDKQTDNISDIFFIHSPIASVITDVEGTIVDVNKYFSKLTGYSSLEFIGQNISLLKSNKHTDEFYRKLWNSLSQVNYHSFEIYNRCKNSSIILVKEQIVRVTKNKQDYFLITLEDITIAKEISEHNRYLATHDPLTGLANRELLHDRFIHALLNAKRLNKKIALLVCDINKFKTINDTYGHSFGDLVLQEVSKKLAEFSRANDTVARYGGDEFMIILEHLEDVNDAKRLAQEIKSIFPMRVVGEECSYDVGMSVGHACYPDEGNNFKELTVRADLNMYKDKKEHYSN